MNEIEPSQDRRECDAADDQNGIAPRQSRNTDNARVSLVTGGIACCHAAHGTRFAARSELLRNAPRIPKSGIVVLVLLTLCINSKLVIFLRPSCLDVEELGKGRIPATDNQEGFLIATHKN